MTSSYVINPSWRKCAVCPQPIVFKIPTDFIRHLREYHCTREGGSYVCKYGFNNVCSSLPGFGVSDEDYENHVAKHHAHEHRRDRESNAGVTRMSSSLMSQQPNVVQDQGQWTVYCSTQNLPAVLNDPGRGKQKDFFTKTWGDSFSDKARIAKSQYLPEITRLHFENYLKKTSKRYKKHMRHSSNLFKEPSDVDLQPFPSLQPSRQLAKKSLLDLQNIPKIFLQANFNLANPDTFDTVFPLHQSQLSPAKIGSNDHNSSRLLQEKLTHYLDVVEMHIAHQISQKSAAFFAAMTSHDVLMENLADTVLAVKRLREKIHQIENILVKDSLQIMGLKRSRQNHVTVYNKLKLIATVHQTQPTIQILLSSSDFVGALDLISTTQEVLAQELAGIHSFRHLGSQLAELEKVINNMIQAEFVRYATADLNRPLTDSELIMEEERLVAIVFGMMHQRRYNFVDLYKYEAFTSIDTIIKQIVIEHVSQTDNDEDGGNFRNLLRPLDFPQWLNLIEDIFANLLKLLTRIKSVHGVMSDVINIAGGKAHCPTSLLANAAQTPEVTNIHIAVDEEADVSIPDIDHKRLVTNLSELLMAVCDHSHERCARVLATKAKDGFLEKLNFTEFVVLSKCIEKFVADCEEVCGKRSTSLRLGLQSQANRFVNRFHDDRKNKLTLILDSERWKQADVPSEFQELVDHISTTGELLVPKKVSETDFIEEKPTQEYIVVDGEKYAVVGTVLLLLKMMMEYCQCIADIPSFTSDLLTRLIELLKMFNSRTCQLVLGAGALQLVGLKSITTRNLALASRCLQLILRYIPIIKIHFEQRLPPKQINMSKHFDQLSKDYSDHVSEIITKLVTIIDSMTEIELNKWEVKPPVPSTAFRNICKQIGKLHEALNDVLTEQQIRALFARINGSFQMKVTRQLQKHNVINDGGPQHGVVTSELAFYAKNLKALKCVANDFDMANNVWPER